MTNKQSIDIETIKWFMPKTLKSDIFNSDIMDFLNFSERGIIPKKQSDGYKALLEGKRWRGIHVGMYEDGVMDGSVPYTVLFAQDRGDMPISVIRYMAKEMFKGIDKNLILQYAA